MTACIFTLQKYYQTDLVRKTLAFAVPITVVAFIIGHLTMPITIGMTSLDGYELSSLFIATIGTALYNWYHEEEEK